MNDRVRHAREESQQTTVVTPAEPPETEAETKEKERVLDLLAMVFVSLAVIGAAIGMILDRVSP